MRGRTLGLLWLAGLITYVCLMRLTDALGLKPYTGSAADGFALLWTLFLGFVLMMVTFGLVACTLWWLFIWVRGPRERGQ